MTAADFVIDTLAASEAQLTDEVLRLEQECDTYKVLFIEALRLIQVEHQRADRARQQHQAVVEEYRALRQLAMERAVAA